MVSWSECSEKGLRCMMERRMNLNDVKILLSLLSRHLVVLLPDVRLFLEVVVDSFIFLFSCFSFVLEILLRVFVLHLVARKE